MATFERNPSHLGGLPRLEDFLTAEAAVWDAPSLRETFLSSEWVRSDGTPDQPLSLDEGRRNLTAFVRDHLGANAVEVGASLHERFSLRELCRVVDRGRTPALETILCLPDGKGDAEATARLEAIRFDLLGRLPEVAFRAVFTSFFRGTASVVPSIHCGLPPRLRCWVPERIQWVRESADAAGVSLSLYHPESIRRLMTPGVSAGPTTDVGLIDGAKQGAFDGVSLSDLEDWTFAKDWECPNWAIESLWRTVSENRLGIRVGPVGVDALDRVLAVARGTGIRLPGSIALHWSCLSGLTPSHRSALEEKQLCGEAPTIEVPWRETTDAEGALGAKCPRRWTPRINWEGLGLYPPTFRDRSREAATTWGLRWAV